MSLDSQQERSAAQFDRQAANYGKGHILENTEDVAALLQMIPKHHGRALDVATGGGHTGLALAKAGYEVVLGDLAPAMLKNAVAMLQAEGHVADSALFPAEAFPFDDKSFDLVSCRVAPHHFSDVAKFVNEAFRVLKPGGYFLVIDGSVADNDPESAAWLHQIEILRDPSHGRFLDRKEWRDLASDSGFEIIHAELHPMLQPDLKWYFRAAATTEENQAKVRELIAQASEGVRETLLLIDQDGPVRWTWQRLSMLCKKP